MSKVNVDLSTHFWIGLVIFIATAISAGTINLTHAIPTTWIPAVDAWSGIISVVGTGYLTAALGLHNASPQAKIDVAAALPNALVVTTPNGNSKIALANKLAALPEIENVVSTPDVAAATPSAKVIGNGQAPLT